MERRYTEKLPKLAQSILWSNVNIHQEPTEEEVLLGKVEKIPTLWMLASLFPQTLGDLVKGLMNKVAEVTGMESVH